jgi:hypothetical protein
MDISNQREQQKEMAGKDYIKWDDPSVEKKPDGEDEDIQAVADMINAIQKAQYNSHRHCYSGENKWSSSKMVADFCRHSCPYSRHH